MVISLSTLTLLQMQGVIRDVVGDECHKPVSCIALRRIVHSDGTFENWFLRRIPFRPLLLRSGVFSTSHYTGLAVLWAFDVAGDFTRLNLCFGLLELLGVEEADVKIFFRSHRALDFSIVRPAK